MLISPSPTSLSQKVLREGKFLPPSELGERKQGDKLEGYYSNIKDDGWDQCESSGCGKKH